MDVCSVRGLVRGMLAGQLPHRSRYCRSGGVDRFQHRRASAARAAIVREAVGSEATRPCNPGLARRAATRHRTGSPHPGPEPPPDPSRPWPGGGPPTAYANRATPPAFPGPTPPRRSSQSTAPHLPGPPPRNWSCRRSDADRNRYSPPRKPSLNMRIVDLDNRHLRVRSTFQCSRTATSRPVMKPRG
jgi:hypothetical protein